MTPFIAGPFNCCVSERVTRRHTDYYYKTTQAVCRRCIYLLYRNYIAARHIFVRVRFYIICMSVLFHIMYHEHNICIIWPCSFLFRNHFNYKLSGITWIFFYFEFSSYLPLMGVSLCRVSCALFLYAMDGMITGRFLCFASAMVFLFFGFFFVSCEVHLDICPTTNRSWQQLFFFYTGTSDRLPVSGVKHTNLHVSQEYLRFVFYCMRQTHKHFVLKRQLENMLCCSQT